MYLELGFYPTLPNVLGKSASTAKIGPSLTTLQDRFVHGSIASARHRLGIDVSDDFFHALRLS